MSELHRKRLQDLRFESSNIVVVALVIAKTTPRTFTSKRSGSTMAVLTFTVRDSKQFITNCICWGSDTNIQDFYRKYHIGDIIDIISPQVTPISPSGKEFHPQTSTPYALSVNEGIGSIEPHMFEDIQTANIKSLSQQPIKPASTALSLADVHSSGTNSTGQFVDLFVVVRMIRPVRIIKTKLTGQEMRCIEVIVMDKTYPTGMSFSIWHDEWIERAEKYWKPSETVLYLLDARLDFSTFYKRTVICFTSKTIILENVNVRETKQLLEFASSVTMNSLDWTVQSFPDPNTITTVMTVQQIYDRCHGVIQDDTEQFTAVLYSVVTKFDLDGLSRPISKKCRNCKRPTPLHRQVCEIDQCQMDISFNGSGHSTFEYYFNIQMHLTDHTGTLTEGRLMNNFAEKLLKCDVSAFQEMSTLQKTQIKWTFLMERVCVKLVVRKKSLVRMNFSAIILDIETIGLEDLVGKILAY